jgi:hypothetical protein
MADAPPRELPAPVRHQALALVEAALNGEQVTWKVAGASEDELRQLLVAAVGLAVVFCRAASARGRVQPTETVAWVRSRI